MPAVACCYVGGCADPSVALVECVDQETDDGRL